MKIKIIITEENCGSVNILEAEDEKELSNKLKEYLKGEIVEIQIKKAACLATNRLEEKL